MVLRSWNSDRDFQRSLQGLDNSETGAQGETTHFYPSCHLCSQQGQGRGEAGEEEARPARTRQGEVGPNRSPQPMVSFQFMLTPAFL